VKRVCGLDLAGGARIGLVVVTSRGTKLVTDTITTRTNRKEGLRGRHSRLSELGRDVLHHAAVCDLVVVQDIGTGPLDRAGSWWWVVGGLIRREVPVAVLPGAVVKRTAGDLPGLYPEANMTKCEDAAALAHLGAVWLGLDVPILDRHRQVAGAEWPEMISS
jgi:hypothetical protein